ncbi:MAG: hypothetical protein ABI165_17425, partial [Bryobacteraceae bacterium]
MNRRKLLQATSLLFVPQTSFSQNSPAAHKVLRKTRLFDAISSTGVDLIQDTLLVQDSILSLHGDNKSRRWAVSCVDIGGTRLWSYPLPSGVYSGLGTSDSGNALLIHAFQTNYEGIPRKNCLLQLDQASGKIGLLGLTDQTGTTSRMHFAGDSYLIRLGNSSVEVWNVNNGVPLVTNSALVTPGGNAHCHVDVIAPGMVSLTPRTAECISMVSIPSGGAKTFPLSSP